MGENVWFDLRMMHTACARRMWTVSYICTYVFVCLFVWLHVIYLPAEYIVEAHTDREQDRRVRERLRGKGKGCCCCCCCRREAEEKRRERRQQVSAWQSRVKYLVLVKRRRPKRTRRTRLQFTVYSSQVTGHSSRTACDRLCNQSCSCRSGHNGTRPDYECQKESRKKRAENRENRLLASSRRW